MSFEKNIAEVFGIDVWELKPEYRADDVAIGSVNEAVSQDVSNIKSIETKNIAADILFSNDVKSSRKISISVSNPQSFELFKEVAAKMFSASNVTIYSKSNIQTSTNEILIKDTEVLTNIDNINAVENKINIFRKCYEYADF